MFISSLMRFFNSLSICILCGSSVRISIEHSSPYFCPGCLRDLPILAHHCYRCAKFLPDGRGVSSRGLSAGSSVVCLDPADKPREDEKIVANKICGDCLSNPPPFERTIALFPYEQPIIKLITALKFQGELCSAEAFGRALLFKIASENHYKNNQLPDLLYAVPLHPKRLRERGFNQSLEIAKPIARGLSMVIDTNNLIRSKHTLAQSGLSAMERKQNVAQAFAVTRDLQGNSVALIDDVITTGNTITACCEALKRKGAGRIDVWCVARRG